MSEDPTPISLETLDGYEFQKFVAGLFEKLGFRNVKLGPPSADGGIDISMEQKTTIGSVRYTVEVKHHPDSSIGRPVVQKLHSAVISTPVLDKGLIITSGRFSKPAMKYAEEVGVELIDFEKLKKLAKEAGMSFADEIHLSIGNCFPISEREEIITRLYRFLENDLIGYNKNSTKIDSITISLYSSFMVDYSIDAEFSTSVGKIGSLKGSAVLYVDAYEGKLIRLLISKAFAPSRHKISKIQEENLKGISVNQEWKSEKRFKDLKSKVIKAIREKHSKRISYYGANGRRYTKTCTPSKRDITVTDVQKVYLPFLELRLTLYNKEFAIVVVESPTDLVAIPGMRVKVRPRSNISAYPGECMICSEKLEDELKYICNDCGAIVCEKDSAKCEGCGKVLCGSHTITKKKFLVLSDKFCYDCVQKQKESPK